jgi:hypothetical protein
MKYIHEYYSKRAIDTFIEKAFEIAFGESAIHKQYDMDEVIEKLREFSDKALEREENE